MSKQVQTSGISTTGLLGVLFIGLKLTGYIDWSWLWVLAPFWIPLALFASIALGVLSIMLVGTLLGGKPRIRRIK